MGEEILQSVTLSSPPEVVYHQEDPLDHRNVGLVRSPRLHQQYQTTEDKTLPGMIKVCD